MLVGDEMSRRKSPPTHSSDDAVCQDMNSFRSSGCPWTHWMWVLMPFDCYGASCLDPALPDSRQPSTLG